MGRTQSKSELKCTQGSEIWVRRHSSAYLEPGLATFAKSGTKVVIGVYLECDERE